MENRQKDLSLYPMYCYGTNSGPTLDSNGRITEKGRKEVFENKDYDADVDEPAAPRLFLTETVAQAKGLTGANIWTKKSRERCINIFRNDLFNAIRRASFNSARFVLPDVPLADPDKSNNKIKTEASEDGASQVQSPAATPSKRSKNTRKPKQSGVTGATSAPAASSSTTGAIPPLPQVTTLSIIPDNPIRSILGQVSRDASFPSGSI